MYYRSFFPRGGGFQVTVLFSSEIWGLFSVMLQCDFNIFIFSKEGAGWKLGEEGLQPPPWLNFLDLRIGFHEQAAFNLYIYSQVRNN